MTIMNKRYPLIARKNKFSELPCKTVLDWLMWGETFVFCLYVDGKI